MLVCSDLIAWQSRKGSRLEQTRQDKRRRCQIVERILDVSIPRGPTFDQPPHNFKQQDRVSFFPASHSLIKYSHLPAKVEMERDQPRREALLSPSHASVGSRRRHVGGGGNTSTQHHHISDNAR